MDIQKQIQRDIEFIQPSAPDSAFLQMKFGN